jgi:hypothetical protein
MKTIVMIIALFCTPMENGYIIINDILYKMPKSEITKIKTTYKVKDKEVVSFKFTDNRCYASFVEYIVVGEVKKEIKEEWGQYKVETTPFFLFRNKFVDIAYFYPTDIASIKPLPIKEAISKYGCKGLNPIFCITVNKGKDIQSIPVGGIMFKQQ